MLSIEDNNAISVSKIKDLLNKQFKCSDLESLDNISKEMEEESFDGAGSYFGHADDAFDAGLRLGEAAALSLVIEALGMKVEDFSKKESSD